LIIDKVIKLGLANACRLVPTTNYR